MPKKKKQEQKPETTKLTFEQYVERYGGKLPAPVLLINYRKYKGIN